MAIKPCRECGASVSTEAQPCPQCGAPDPTKDKSVAAEPIKDKSAAAETIKGTAGPVAPAEHKKSRWLIQVEVFSSLPRWPSFLHRLSLPRLLSPPRLLRLLRLRQRKA